LSERERERERWSLAVCRSAGGSSTSLRGMRRRRRICTTTTVYYNYHSTVPFCHTQPISVFGQFCVIRSKMVIMEISLQEKNEKIFLKQHPSIFFGYLLELCRKYGYFCFGLNFGLILAIEILKKHMILALSDFTIAFLDTYI
jgi:hypothetical protein